MKHGSSPFIPVLRRILAAVWLGASLVALAGCIAAAGAGAGAVAYVRGDLEAQLGNDYNDVVAATRQALTDLEFTKVSDSKDALKALLISRTALDKKVEIIITKSGNKLTSIKIRVGLIGDQDVSVAILDKIKARL